jgi:hypothetical protein
VELKSRSLTSKEPHVAREPQVADPWPIPFFTIYCDVLPSNVSVICGFWILYLDLLDKSLGVNCSLADLLYSSVLLVPIRCLVHARLQRLLFTHHWTVTSHLELAENYFENRTTLACTEPASFGTRYITSAPTTHRKLRLYFWNVFTESLHSNGHGAN